MSVISETFAIKFDTQVFKSEGRQLEKYLGCI